VSLLDLEFDIDNELNDCALLDVEVTHSSDDKSAVAEHSIELDHRIQFRNTAILTSKSHYLDRIIMEAIEIVLHQNNMNKEAGFCLNKSWKPLICSLKKTPQDHPSSSTSLTSR
jgi:hypothetical protein